MGRQCLMHLLSNVVRQHLHSVLLQAVKRCSHYRLGRGFRRFYTCCQISINKTGVQPKYMGVLCRQFLPKRIG